MEESVQCVICLTEFNCLSEDIEEDLIGEDWDNIWYHYFTDCPRCQCRVRVEFIF